MKFQMIVPSDGQVIVSYRVCYKKKTLPHCMICFTALRPLYFRCKSFRLKTFFCLSNMGKRRRTNNCCLPGQQPLPVGLQPLPGQHPLPDEQESDEDLKHTTSNGNARRIGEPKCFRLV